MTARTPVKSAFDGSRALLWGCQPTFCSCPRQAAVTGSLAVEEDQEHQRPTAGRFGASQGQISSIVRPAYDHSGKSRYARWTKEASRQAPYRQSGGSDRRDSDPSASLMLRTNLVVQAARRPFKCRRLSRSTGVWGLLYPQARYRSGPCISEEDVQS